MTIFNIKSYYDTICPWCYISSRSLSTAISLWQKTYPGGSQDTFTFTYLPFYLKPPSNVSCKDQAPNHNDILDALSTQPQPQPQSTPMLNAITTKNGETMARGIVTRLERIGASYGINFTFKGLTGPSALSHRLVYLAGTKSVELQEKVLDAIFFAHFESDGDITSRVLMLQIGEKVGGFSRREMEEWFDDEEVRRTVDALAGRAREVDGVRQVPTYEINGTRVEGSQDPGEFYEVFVKVKGE